MLAEFSAVVLCGGRGTRLGSVTAELPKPLVKLHDEPILWYTCLTLFERGFRHIILPLGYRGELIREFVNQRFCDLPVRFDMIDTGEDVSIAERLDRISHRIADGSDFFLVNGDTFFDFDVAEMLALHRKNGADLTVSSVEITSPYGLVIERDGAVIDFAKDRKIDSVSLSANDKSLRGYVNAGLSWINKRALDLVDPKNCQEFEQELFARLAREGRAAHYKIDGKWFAVDTQKDLAAANQHAGTSNRISEIVKGARETLASRYEYRTRYVDRPDALLQRILDKTVIPHQVEIQPGPDPGKAICWLKCPYCYGATAEDTAERLPHDRYIEILHQIARGGVNKLVFAGYATDPLNYSGIDDLLEVAKQHGMIFGFHTKALRVTAGLVDLMTDDKVSPFSYFSVSVDAGTNETYNRVHGVEDSPAKLYDKVLENLRVLTAARDKSSAPLDISATYLLTDHNSDSAEVEKALADLRESGVDLIRFTYPQAPRGYSDAIADFVPERTRIDESMSRLRPMIEAASDERCQSLIMDLDRDHDVYRKPRTLPCYSRFVFPSIGFDGYLSHCSESAAPHFRSLALGDLRTRDFWDLFYDYDTSEFSKHLEASAKTMCATDCHCDRKEHIVNTAMQGQVSWNNDVD